MFALTCLRSLAGPRVLLALVVSGGCGDLGQPNVTGARGKSQDGDPLPSQYDFLSAAPTDYEIQTDHLGVSLISTVLLNRSDRYNCRGVANLPHLLSIARGLVHLHDVWTPGLRRKTKDAFPPDGVPLCVWGDQEDKLRQLLARHTPDAVEQLDDVGLIDLAKTLLGILKSTPCTLQQITRQVPGKTQADPPRTIEGPKVIDLITPDHITLTFTKSNGQANPGGFPNGRRPDDPITDLILAMGMVNMDPERGDSVRADEVQLNPSHNDVPFAGQADVGDFAGLRFPYLAEAHRQPSANDYR